MSQDAADTTSLDGRRAVAGQDRETHPRAPSFTAGLDRHRGVVRARGHLDELAADLLRGTIIALQREGHRRVTVQLEPLATADDAARELLDRVAGELAAQGVSLVVG